MTAGHAPDTSTMKAEIEIFDPPMCCSTGLCGPTLDQTLLDVEEMILQLQKEGRRVHRYQMTSEPQAFLHNAEVMALVRARPLDALPITIVNGRVIKTGAYPEETDVRVALKDRADD